MTPCNKPIILAVSLVLASLSLKAQSPSSLDELYGNSKHNVVILELKTEVNIEVDKDELSIEERTYQKNYYTNALTNGFGKVDLSYEPPFTAFKDLSANLYLPNFEKNEYDREKVKRFEDRKVLENDVFHDGTRSKFFEFEGLRKGSITEMDYVKTISEPQLIGREIFNASILVANHHLVLEYDNDVDLEFEYFNCDSTWFTFKRETVKGNRQKVSWTKKNIEPLEREANDLPFLAKAPHIVYRIKSYQTKDNKVVKVTETPADLYSWYSSLINFNAQLDTNTKSITQELIANLDTDFAKAKAIYNWVNSSIRYIAIEDGIGGFKPREATLVCDRRYGDCKDMSNLMVQMMRYAGLKAYHTWVGTRELPYTYTQTPSVLTDNHMICGLNLNNQWFFIDATNKNLPFPMPSSFTQGKEALVGLDADNYLILPIPVVSANENIAHDVVTAHLENGKLVGSGQCQLRGYHAYYANNALETNEQERKERYIESTYQKGSNKCKTTLTSYESSDTSCAINYEFTVPNYAKALNDKIFINLNLEKPFTSMGTKPERKSGLEFKSESKLVFNTRLEIPEGYRVAFIPNDHTHTEENYAFSSHYSLSESAINYTISIEIKTLRLALDDLPNWNNFIEDLKTVYNQSLTLQKL